MDARKKKFFFVAIITFISVGVWIFLIQNSYESSQSLEIQIASILKHRIHSNDSEKKTFKQASSRSNQYPILFGPRVNKSRYRFNLFEDVIME